MHGSVQWEWDTHVLVDDGLTLLPDNVLLLGTEGAGSSGRSPNSIVRLTVTGGAPESSALFHGTRVDRIERGTFTLRLAILPHNVHRSMRGRPSQ